MGRLADMIEIKLRLTLDEIEFLEEKRMEFGLLSKSRTIARILNKVSKENHPDGEQNKS